MCWSAQMETGTNKLSKLSYISNRGKKDVYDRSDVKVGEREKAVSGHIRSKSVSGDMILQPVAATTVACKHAGFLFSYDSLIVRTVSKDGKMAIKRAPSRYAHDSDSDDLPELDALINKHVKGLPALNALKLIASKPTQAPKLAPRKPVEKTTRSKSETIRTNAPPKRSTRTKTSNEPLTELKSAPEVRRSVTEPKLQPKARGQAVLKELETKTKETEPRAAPHRNAKPASRRLPRIEDSDSEESHEEVEEEDVEESIHCESDTEDEVPAITSRAVNKPTRRLVAGRRSPDLDSSDSDEDVFHTPPSKQSQRPEKKSFTAAKASDDLTQKLLQLDLDGSDKENDNLAILKL